MGKGTTAKSARRKARKKRGIITTRKKKEFTYRGYTLDGLQKLTVNELMPLLPARARRSLRRGLNESQQRLLDRLRKDKERDTVIRTHQRDFIILPEFVGWRIAVHNGSGFKEFTIIPEMIGHYLGEFALTRKSVTHTGPGVGATRSSKYVSLK